MVFIVNLINDSIVINSMEDFNETTPQELYEKYGEVYLYVIIGKLITDYTKLEKMYGGDYNFTEEELLFLINQLNYVDNKYLVDMILFAKYENLEFIEDKLNEDLLKIYRDKVIENKVVVFIKRKNINILKWICKNQRVIVDIIILEYCCQFGNLEIFEFLITLYYKGFNKDFPLSIPIRYGNIEILKFLMNRYPNRNFDNYLLITAAEYGHLEI